MRLFIAEKPSVAKAIAEELGVTSKGEGYLEWGCGRKPPEFPDNYCALILVFKSLTSKFDRLM